MSKSGKILLYVFGAVIVLGICMFVSVIAGALYLFRDPQLPSNTLTQTRIIDSEALGSYEYSPVNNKLYYNISKSAKVFDVYEYDLSTKKPNLIKEITIGEDESVADGNIFAGSNGKSVYVFGEAKAYEINGLTFKVWDIKDSLDFDYKDCQAEADKSKKIYTVSDSISNVSQNGQDLHYAFYVIFEKPSGERTSIWGWDCYFEHKTSYDDGVKTDFTEKYKDKIDDSLVIKYNNDYEDLQTYALKFSEKFYSKKALFRYVHGLCLETCDSPSPLDLFYDGKSYRIQNYRSGRESKAIDMVGSNYVITNNDGVLVSDLDGIALYK